MRFTYAHLNLAALASLFLLAGAASAQQGAEFTQLPGHVPTKAISSSQHLGRIDSASTLSLALALPLRNQAALDDFLARVYDPADPAYGHFLSSAEFAARFSPTQADYDLVAAFARARGLTVTCLHSNRLVLDVAGPASAVEAAFNVELHEYQKGDGRVFHAPLGDPIVPSVVAARLAAVVGLDNSAVWHTHNQVLPAGVQPSATALQIGTGPGSALAPNDIKAAYNLNGTAPDGRGQTLALFEMDGYHASDIAGYEAYYGLPAVPLQNVLVDNYSGAAGGGANEVTLDIELQAALAPGASKIIVYEGPNSGAGDVDLYNRIATDNVAKEISTSWGLSELSHGAALRNSENAIFQQMAAQGQSIFAASGDRGAYDNSTTVTVDDPASQPYVCGVGGTQLFVNPGETYSRETTWNNGSPSAGAGGGGVSQVWAIPAWQNGVVSPASGGSQTHRNVPDVSLNSDPNTGYSVYFNGGWYLTGGTSCAAPLWSAFAARVNQQRLANGSPLLGFPNPPLYQIARGAHSAADFHDVADGSTNLFYSAVAGYDDATGWGSFNGANLLADLAPAAAAGPPAAPTNPTATPGNAQIVLSWTASAGATSYHVKRATVNGGPYATVGSPTAATFTDAPLTNGTTYYYVVTAVNGAREGSASAQVSATPTAPTGGLTLSSLTVNPSTVKSYAWPKGTVTMSGVVPTGSIVVNLTSSNPAVAKVPATITLWAGASSKSFDVQTQGVTTTATVTLSATYAGVTRTATLTVTPK